jgi:hypothetical protein
MALISTCQRRASDLTVQAGKHSAPNRVSGLRSSIGELANRLSGNHCALQPACSRESLSRCHSDRSTDGNRFKGIGATHDIVKDHSGK